MIFPKTFLSVLLAGVLSATITGCASSGDTYSENASTNAPSYDEKQVFSPNTELDYLSSSEEYRIGIADELNVEVFRVPDLSGKTRVETDGTITLPLIGSVKVVGLTKPELESKLESTLEQRYMRNPKVTVYVNKATSQRITVDGMVGKPGLYPITAGQITVLQAIALAGGTKNLADPSKTVLFRKSGDKIKAYRLNIDDIRDGKVRDPYVRNNDTIVVHRSGSRYWLAEVARNVGSAFGIIRPFGGL